MGKSIKDVVDIIQENPPEREHCPRILSVDGGGVRGLSSLLILRNIMEEIARRTNTAEALPCEHFDLIGGTGTGGLIAIMLGRLRMSVNECVDEFIDLSKKVFEVDQVLNGEIPFGDEQCRFDYQKLESAVQNLVERRLRDANAAMAETIVDASESSINKNARTFVVASKNLHADGPPTLFRSYQCRGHNADKCAIWEATRATNASPTLFKPIRIEKPPPGITFVGGELLYNNPAELAISEAKRIWTDAKHFCIVSLGTGYLKSVRVVNVGHGARNFDVQAGSGSTFPRSKRIRVLENLSAGLGALRQIGEVCVQLAASSEPVHQRVLRNSHDPEKIFRYHRFNVEREMHDVEIQEWAQMEAIGAHTSRYMEEAEGERKRNECVQDLLNPWIRPVATTSPKYFLMPYQRNAHFTGRDELLTLLSEKLRDTGVKKYNHRVAIYGMGGVGKTQLAIEYVHRNKAEYDSIFWISSADQAVLLSGFQEIACMVECIPNSQTDLKPAEVARRVLGWLQRHERWLLVMDNMDEIEVAVDYIPKIGQGGHTLITTRNPDHLTIPAEGLHIPVLNQDAAIELLLLRSGIECTNNSPDRRHAAEIVTELGCLALAIEQAAAYIRSSMDALGGFLTTYRRSRHRFLQRKLAQSHPYPNSVAATFLLSLKKLEDVDHGIQAITLLRLLAFLNPDGVLVEFLRSASDGLDNALRDVVEDELTLHDTLELLQRYALVEVSQKREYIVIHRLVQAVIKDMLNDAERTIFLDSIVSLCDSVYPDYIDPLPSALRMKWRKFQSQILEPFVEIAMERKSRRTSDVLYRFGHILTEEGNYVDSIRVLKLCVDIRVSLYGEEAPKTLMSMSMFAGALWHEEKLDQALDLEEKVLDARMKTLGKEHPGTLAAMSNLARSLWSLEKYTQAIAIEREVLEARYRISGEESRDTLLAMANLASTLTRLGQLEEAAALQEKALEARFRIFGEKDADTWLLANWLAQTYLGQGKLDKSAALQEKSVDALRGILGEEHPIALGAMFHLTKRWQQLGKWDEAEVLASKVLDARMRTLGKDDLDTLSSMEVLSGIWWDQGKNFGAMIAMEEKILDGRRQILGETRPETVRAMANLALSYEHCGRRQDALDLMEKAIDVSREHLGEDHPDTRDQMEYYKKMLGTAIRSLWSWSNKSQKGIR